MYKIYLFFLLIALHGGCNTPSTEKHQNSRDNIVKVHDKVNEIKTGNILLNSNCLVYIIDRYLLISDPKTPGNQIHIFDKNNFDYITGTAPVGQGPGEITVIGHIVEDSIRHQFYVSDFGKQRIFSYDLDSVLTDSLYLPQVKIILNQHEFPNTYTYIDDTLSFGVIIKPTGNYGFNQTTARWNMQTGEIHSMKTLHPELKKQRFAMTASLSAGRYVECHHYHDLMSICELNGHLLYNIYGPDWDPSSAQFEYYKDAVFCNDKIVALYSHKADRTKPSKSTQFLVFDLNGDYIKTLETDYNISRFCYDKENHRLILSMDDDIQFGYLDLQGLVD